jgi:hypothetical protein
MLQLRGRANRQSRVVRNRKTDFCATFHAEDDPTIDINGGKSFASYRSHATIKLSRLDAPQQVLAPSTVRLLSNLAEKSISDQAATWLAWR